MKNEEKGRVRFRDMQAVRNKYILDYYSRKFRSIEEANKDVVGRKMVIHMRDGTYAMVNINEKGEPIIDRVHKPCLFLESLDRNELPDTLEDFRNQYVMDEHASKIYKKRWG